ncbi:ATP-binding protein [Cognatiyoonia koreensis]|uniref:ATP-binding response regulator n=1 Tax=Cognatiyoonia koreensis TaxID=364200 RepID=UPI001F620CD1|nr:ATP-binding protein [Cognatiyoonia koreensis]
MDPDQRQLRRLLDRQTPKPHAAAIAGIALACAIGAYWTTALIFKVALLVFGGSLGAIALFQVMRQRKEDRQSYAALKQQNMIDEAVQSLVAHDSDIIFLTDLDGDIRFSNAAASAKFGDFDDTHLSAVFGRILAHPEAILFRLQGRAARDGAAKEDVVTRNGQFRLSVVQVGDASYLWRVDDRGDVARSTVRATDALTLPMMTVGKSNAILYLNDAFRNLLGYRPKSLREVFDDLPVDSGNTVRIVTEDGPARVITGVVDGGTGRREIYLLPAQPSGNPIGPRPLHGGWDAIEDLPVPLLKIGEGGVVLASNREARTLFGLKETDGMKVSDILDGLGRPVNDWIREALSGQGGHVSQFLRGRGIKQETFVQVTLNLAKGSEGTHLVAVLNDVTELKTLEAQFVQSQKMQAIGQLAGGVAHDFNNLLTAISGHCDLLLLRHDQGDQDYSDLIQIHQNANRAASLVGQLLAFSRKQNLQLERIDLRDTLSDLAHLLNRLVGEKVTLVLNHNQELASIKADKRQLEQVMMNLVVNARDAMPQGGEIHVVTENLTLQEELERDRATIPAGEYVVLRVIDEGEGIAPEKLPKIFEPFYTTKRTGEGTGLGLSTVYGIVKQTGGFIFAESALGQGTEFEVILPAHTLPVAERAPVLIDPPEPVAATGDGVVLLVEDEAPVRAFASRALSLRGYTVLEADCAETALSLLADPDLEVDIFVTDVIMPGKDGPTWVREALESRPDTKVIFVSGYAEDAFGDESEHIPNSVFLPKPFSLNQLTTTVQAQLH